MRKRLISICIVVICYLGTFGCTQTAKDVPAAESETEEIENTDMESEDEADRETIISHPEVEESVDAEDI